MIGRAVNPPDLEYEIRIVLPLADWKTFLSQVSKMDGNTSYPAWRVIDKIRECVNHAENHFTGEI